MNDKFFSYFCLVLLLLLPILLLTPCRSGIFYNKEYRDTIIFNVTYRDTTIYSIKLKDSTVYDYTYISLKDTIRINDTLYFQLPLSWYWFQDESADIYCTGYNVRLDSVRYHFREVTKMVENTVVIKPPRLSVDGGVMMYGGGYIDADVAASLRLGDRWSVDVKAGLSTRDGLSPIAGIGVRYRIR